MNQVFKGLAESKAAYEAEQKLMVQSAFDDLKEMQTRMGHMINITPTGGVRNLMTEVNIHLSSAVLKVGMLHKRLNAEQKNA